MLSSRIFIIIVAGYIISSCNHIISTSDKAPPISPIRSPKHISDAKKSLFIEYPVPESFSICYGHTCRYIEDLSLTEEEWSRVRNIFLEKNINPENERENIRSAVGLMETIVGEKTGTSSDRGKNFDGFGLPGQMDCVDESTNTTVYLTMMQNDGLLKWHRVRERSSRGIFSLQAPHFTAVISETDSDQGYAVDSWFLENGQPPFIIPLKTWAKGWEPDHQ